MEQICKFTGQKKKMQISCSREKIEIHGTYGKCNIKRKRSRLRETWQLASSAPKSWRYLVPPSLSLSSFPSLSLSSFPRRRPPPPPDDDDASSTCNTQTTTIKHVIAERVNYSSLFIVNANSDTENLFLGFPNSLWAFRFQFRTFKDRN